MHRSGVCPADAMPSWVAALRVGIDVELLADYGWAEEWWAQLIERGQLPRPALKGK